MKKDISSLWLMLVALSGFTACADDDDVSYKEATVSGYQVYFSNALASKINLDGAATMYKVPVLRVEDEEALTVPLTVTNEGGLITVPSSVSFAAGQKEANLILTYDVDNLGYDNYQDITITIAEEYATLYGYSSYTFSIGIPAPWTSLGTGKFSDTFWSDDPVEVEIQQNDLDAQTFRLVKPYDVLWEGDATDPDDYVEFRVYHAGETLRGEVLEQDVIYYTDISTGYFHPTYGALVYALFPGRLTSMASQAYWTHNTVLSYQSNGLPAVVQMAPYYYMFGVGGWNYTQNDEMITIVFPGVVIADYAVSISYAGKFIDGDDKVFAVGDVTLGADVAVAKVAVVEGRSMAEEGYEAIVNGTAENITEVTASGEVRVAMPAEAASGVYTMVAVSYNAAGEPQKSEYVNFNYTASGEVAETWTEAYVGTYTYKYVFNNSDGTPYDDEGLPLYVSDQYENRYKISNVFYGVDFIFTLHEDYTITFEDQFTGADNSATGAGDLMCSDMHALYPDRFPTASYYSNGVFYFNIGYYASNGWWGYDTSDDNDNLETFTLTGNASANRESRAAALSKPFVRFTGKTMGKHLKGRPVVEPLAD